MRHSGYFPVMSLSKLINVIKRLKNVMTVKLGVRYFDFITRCFLKKKTPSNKVKIASDKTCTQQIYMKIVTKHMGPVLNETK